MSISQSSCSTFSRSLNLRALALTTSSNPFHLIDSLHEFWKGLGHGWGVGVLGLGDRMQVTCLRGQLSNCMAS